MDDRGLPLPLVADMLRRYAEPHRRYHDTEHLDIVLRHIDMLAELASDPAAVRLAAWFHDAVYEPDRIDNEAASATLAEVLLPANGIPADRIAEVARLVRLTATHSPDDDDLNGAVLCDADLAILGSDPADYAHYVEQIRDEYRRYDDITFAIGRSQVLTALLQQPQLFRTRIAKECWEAAARRNITAELTDLAKVAASADGVRQPSAE